MGSQNEYFNTKFDTDFSTHRIILCVHKNIKKPRDIPTRCELKLLAISPVEKLER